MSKGIIDKGPEEVVSNLYNTFKLDGLAQSVPVSLECYMYNGMELLFQGLGPYSRASYDIS